ncbi:polyprenyl synthetase family protein [Ehrlichia canis]|uniref:Farnesyl-diphosphate synthase n=1 Tax=Ehrlichia canis (strain Jake) TaxID=269484 RepID=A0ACA6AW54_EHRCJ|nr:polyprenyl synthetase family protein [Ehrlichia canis]AAZ68602.1 farnesyl-diphosphate synthase [Ehrlichia canis str. Jake]
MKQRLEGILSCNISELMKHYSSLLIQKLESMLPENNQDILLTSIRYSIFSPGKHIRPFLVNAVAQMFDVNVDRTLPVSAAVEIIHVYSLIHDDLPGMDNEEIRRGQASSHKKFNEAVAILTGDALLTLAFEILSTINESPLIRCRIIKTLAHAIGYQGMIQGQILDTETIAKDINEIQNIHVLKTAQFFSAICELGGILGNASNIQLNALANYGLNLGHAFQIKDDIADEDQDKSKNNILNIINNKDAKNYASNLIDKSIEHLTIFSHKADILHSLAGFIRNL